MKVLPQLPFLETMITQVCNLSCQGCTNFSDLRHKGYVSWNQGKLWIEPWLQRVNILDFGIMGGEPLINPEWKQWVQGIRFLMPKAQIRFTTNGLLLPQHREILDFFEDIGNVVFKISVHIQNLELEQSILDFKNLKKWEVVEEYGIRRWKTKNNLRFQINRPEWFYKTFQGSYKDMLPHDSDPQQAFAICVQKTCPLLHNGKIYKCSTSALTPEILNRHQNPNLEKWKPYHDHGISPDCTQHQLEEFLNNFGKPHAICGQCPTINDIDSKLNHRLTVNIK